jgi:hypothetical protein
MSERINQLTDKVLSTFKENLNETASAAMTTRDWDSLRALVREALTSHAAAVAEDLRLVMNKITGDIDKPDIGL